MCVFVTDYLRIKIAVSVRAGRLWSHITENAQNDLSTDTVGSPEITGNVRITIAKRMVGSVLRGGYHPIAVEATASEIVRLEVAPRFGESEVVKPVVHPVAPIEKVDHSRTGVDRKEHTSELKSRL